MLHSQSCSPRLPQRFFSPLFAYLSTNPRCIRSLTPLITNEQLYFFYKRIHTPIENDTYLQTT